MELKDSKRQKSEPLGKTVSSGHERTERTVAFIHSQELLFSASDLHSIKQINILVWMWKAPSPAEELWQSTVEKGESTFLTGVALDRLPTLK